MASSPLAFVSAISSISTSSLFNLFNPSAYAKNIIDENKCTQNSVLANEKDIAVGPACDVQYGVPTDYMGIEPDQVASELSASGDIDEDGKVKSNSELQDWIDTCNQASIINTKECTVDSRQRALYNLYQIDKRTVDGMDEDRQQVQAQDQPPAALAPPCQMATLLAWPNRLSIIQILPTMAISSKIWQMDNLRRTV